MKSILTIDDSSDSNVVEEADGLSLGADTTNPVDELELPRLFASTEIDIGTRPPETVEDPEAILDVYCSGSKTVIVQEREGYGRLRTFQTDLDDTGPEPVSRIDASDILVLTAKGSSKSDQVVLRETEHGASVGIGTNYPASKLHVDGTITAHGLSVAELDLTELPTHQDAPSSAQLEVLYVDTTTGKLYIGP